MSSNPSSASRLSQLAALIRESVTKLEETLSAQGFQSPSLDEDAPQSLPRDTVDMRDVIIDCAAELQALLLGPLEIIYRNGAHNNCVSLQAISRLKIASLVPIGGQTTFAKIAEQTGLDERAVRRLLRHAMTLRVFREPEPGVVAHTKVSKVLTNPVANDWCRAGTEEMWPAATKMVDAFQKWPGSPEPNHTGFSLANNTEDSIYQVLEKNPERASRFANTMIAYTMMTEYDTSHIFNNYDWKSLGQVQMIDVGGGAGHHSMELARRFPNLSVIVQDMNEMFEGIKVPEELEGRFEFMAYDLFAPQTVQADVYFFRWIFHNWSDKYSIMIIKALIPALKPGAKIILNESCMPEPGEIAHWREQDLRSFDISMGASFNSYERSLDEWKALLSEADPRFVFQRVSGAKDSALSIIEFVWSDGKH
ncbi:sterigmatocystin 8-O-methyltransferase [Annulohypoxylon truncatum]|uniref:sterigmatocystin 8-O-methyltransferase n=1 Tax=Annulohypoxylon truncatum TaxID=327061 RepID=UPI002007EFD3|nr:sterigmatocystin 8-O-methyltransferase [Annulohypoxylon truncatum]KAI1207204.1 sterigmatocystin 8-O-methyltransferase [Annulohypoxylon truncatum]